MYICIIENKDQKRKMKYIGAHVPIAGGIENAPLNAQAMGAKAFAFFTKNQRRWFDAPYTEENIRLFKQNCRDAGFESAHILPHDNYFINLGNPDAAGLQKSRKAFTDEMKRCQQLGLCMLNFHPGSSLAKITDEACMDLIAESINLALDKTQGVSAVIENTAGQGSNLGYTFEQIAYIIDKVEDKERVGVCLDTCHTFAAGYDITTETGYSEVLEHFDEVIGFSFLRALHLNDSKKGLGSHVDRHEIIGKGEMGIEVFRRILHDPRFDGMPLILETPNEGDWKEEIERLYKL